MNDISPGAGWPNNPPVAGAGAEPNNPPGFAGVGAPNNPPDGAIEKRHTTNCSVSIHEKIIKNPIQ